MIDGIVATVAIVVLVGELLYAFRCALWMRQRYGRRLMRSAVWDRLMEGQARTIIAGCILLFLIVVGAIGYVTDSQGPVLPRPVGTILLTIAFVLLLYGPIADKRMIQRLEREGADSGKPPLIDQDV